MSQNISQHFYERLQEYHRVDINLNCIKGGGACHLREKVLAEAANTLVIPLIPHTINQQRFSFILVADYRKNVETLCTNVRQSTAFPKASHNKA